MGETAPSAAHGDDATADTLKRILEAFNRHDLDAIMAFFADDCVLEMPLPGPAARARV